MTETQNNIKEYRQELTRIIKVVKSLRSLKKGKKTTWKQAVEWHLKYANLNGAKVLALTITLSPTGCEWARKGGCTMCGEFEGAYKRNFLIKNPKFHIAQFAVAIGNSEIWKAARKEGMSISWLRILQEGNYTNINETNLISQETILRLATRINGIKRITIESRPQYLNEDNLASLAKIFNETDVELEIGMGVEVQDDIVRSICINKQGSASQFFNAIKLLKKYNIIPLAYVLLKPPFLTEQEAIDEAVKTAHFAAEIGFLRISFEPMSIHAYTLVDALAQLGYYKVPWLWSVVEVIKRCADISKIFGIGGVGYYPVPNEYAHNHCSNDVNCNEKLSKVILKYNETRDVTVFDDLTCSCKTIWEKECQYVPKSLKIRIQEQLVQVEEFYTNYKVKKMLKNNIIRNMRLLAYGSQT